MKTTEFEYVNRLAAKRPKTASKAYDDISKRLRE